jgi:hypothetical protein
MPKSFGGNMNKKEKYHGKWVLLNKKRKVIYSSNDIVKIIEKGKEYPVDGVSIEKKLVQGTCFF